MEVIKNSRIRTIFYLLATGLLLCFWGFYNKYPLVFPDTGTYLLSGFTNVVPKDRPLIYGLFLRHASLAETLWLVIWVQGILVSILVFYYFKYLSPTRKFLPLFFIYIFLITFFTGASVNVSQLIPDVFTPMSVLSMGLLIFVKELKIRDLIIVSALLVLSTSVHTSHVLSMTMFTVLLSVGFLFKKVRSFFPFLKYQRIILIWALIIFTYLSVSTIHYGFSGEFTLSKGKHVFLMGRLIDMEIVNDYLKENCDDHDYKLCEFKDIVIWDFLWESQSPLYKTGGWEDSKEEYTTIIRDIFTTPKYLKIFMMKSIESSFIQFFNYETGDTPRQAQNSAPYGVITRFMPGQVKAYLSSKQCNDRLDFTFLNNYQNYLIVLSLLISILLLILKIPVKSKMLIIYILVSLYINAGVCGTFSGISPRYQSRVIWLLPLPIILTLANKHTFKMLLGKKDMPE
ncbi:hypothetical protein ACFLTA_06000 [Bacteroidota bacterium]